MPNQLKSLVELQRIDCYLKEVEKEKEELPQKLQEMEQELVRASATLKKLEERLQEMQKKRRALEKEVEAEEDRIKKLAAKSSQVKTNKEYQALLKEIDQAKQANWEREEEILNLMTQSEEGERNLAHQKEQLKKKGNESNRRQAELKTRLDYILAGAEEKRQTRTKLLKQIEPPLVKRYQFVSSKLGTAVVPVKGMVCQGCHMRLAPQTLVDLKTNRDLITCPSCHRILFLEELPV